MLSSYGTSCFLQILDEEPDPSENRQEDLRKLRMERAKRKQQLFKKYNCLTNRHVLNMITTMIVLAMMYHPH